jgi:methylenetetrahydrofolate dehydrogenase (NADP+)/methenyltetrahydrofolate cyclohydrolase
MVQLPLVDKKTDERLCQMIRKEKDVDGLNPVSTITPATARAVVAIVAEGLTRTGKDGNWPMTLMIIGSKGNVGRAVMNLYKGDVRFKLVGAGRGEVRAEEVKKADIVVSASGQQGLLTANMIKPGAVVVDVGYPGGDALKEVETVAGFYTPVPGGVGPVTVAMLYRNMLDLVSNL